MDFSFSSEQQDLRAAVRDVAADRCSPARLREVLDNHDGYDADLWSLVARELGLVGVAVSEASGGMGGSFVDAAVALEAAGAALFPVPLLSSVVTAVALDRAGAGDLAAPVAAGEWVAALVVAPTVMATGGGLSGVAAHVVDGHRADLLVVASSDGLFALEASAASVVGAPSLDLTRWQATVTFDGTAARQIGDAEASARAVDLLRVGLAVEVIGGARHCLDSTVDYLKTRVQFGKPIGSFQALQHRAADLAVDLEAAASTAYYAAWAAADSPDELPVLAPLAKSVCADAAYRIAAETIQLHGGIGFTWEHDAHLYFKRATATRLLLGDGHRQRALVAERARLHG
ncbi:MAG: acyl-CoA/acyl-ACP dehydrogenase [Frankiaceae bacterium]|nr:acyl-CoA/acyl-ACP dehydrogenase [Frankiaceae bacterium]MBV9872643.1 acyl-CoA/acyl-ACP dehydrogenase [Frankiaceae bacterium]